MDLKTLIETMIRDNMFARIALNLLAQFGALNRVYLGASILPERLVDENMYTEDSIRYRTVVANAGTRYSPAQKKGSDVVGSFDVKLGNSDIARQFTGRDYDILLKLLRRNVSMDAMSQLVNWADTVLNLALVEYNEKQRWQAIVDAKVVAEGDNGYTYDVDYSNPAGHRVNAAGTWSSDAYDPYDDITLQVNLLASKGYTVSRIIAPTPVVSIMAGNANIAQRCGKVVVAGGGGLTMVGGRPSRAAINAMLTDDGLPAIETYDLRYRTQSGDQRFLSASAMVFLCTTGRDETIDLGDGAEPLVVNDTLGYEAVGIPAGEATPGRVIKTWPKDDKPPRIDGEAWQTSLPVITEPEAIAVIKSIS